MTQAALQSILNEYGDKVKIIVGTGFKIFLNHAKSAETLKTSDIQFKAFGGTQFIVYPDVDTASGKTREVIVPVTDVIKIVTVDSDIFDPYRY